MMKTIIAVLSFLTIATCLNAQSLIKKVNDIKLSDDYFWTQCAYPLPEDALTAGIEGLKIKVEVHVVKDVEVSVEELRPYVKHIFLKGKEVTRAFVYIKKTDAKLAVEEILKKREPVNQGYTPDPLAEEIMSFQDIYAVRDYFESCIKTGSILQWGSPKNAEDINDKYLVFFASDNLKPICVLSPAIDGDKRTNLINGESDTMSNHHGSYAFWFNVKE